MKGLRFVLMMGIITLLSVLGAALPLEAQAASVCGPLDNPSTGCDAAFDLYEPLTIRAGVPFVWLRKDPSSSAAVVGTMNYSGKTNLAINRWPSRFDGYQNWWLVSSTSNKSLVGWVEQSSLVLVNAPDSGARANWNAPFTGGIRKGIPFVWIRNAPNSNAAIVATLLPKDQFGVLGNPQPVNDSRQWWWYIRASTAAGVKEGYIEQASIVVVGNSLPTLVPSPVPSLVPTHVADTPPPTCDTMTVSPATYRNGGGIYYVTRGSYITFRVEGLSNLASITFNVPGSDSPIWRNGVGPRQLDFPGEKAEVYVTVPQAYGWALVSAEAVGLNGETIQCGVFWVDNGGFATATPEAANAPETTPESSG